jgi:hypothetical protein
MLSGTPWAQNTTGKPAAERYALGRGALWFAEHDDNEDPDGDGWEHLGNCPALTASVSRQFLDHFSSLDGKRDRDARIVIEELFDLKYTLDEPSETAAAHWLSATPEDYTNPAVAGITERELVAAVKLGRQYPILNAAGDQAFGIDSSDLVLEQQGATQVVAAGGRTLTFAAADDSITASTGSFITDGYRVGHALVVAGTVSNDGTYEIATVTALVITTVEALTNEGPLSTGETLDSPDVVLVEDVDYEVDEAAGEVFFLTTATKLLEDDAVDMTLAANSLAENMRKIPVQSRGEVTGALKFIGVNPRAESAGLKAKYVLYVPKVTINADGDLSLITEQNLTLIPFTASALKKDADTPIATLYALPAGGVT